MMPAPNICRRARQARDPRFDGRFIVGVLTTGIFCRPVCPARLPLEDNVRYYSSAAAAAQAGYRPCLRCRPEDARALPEWTISSQTVIRAMRYINGGFLSDHRVAELASRLNIGVRQLNRLFREELGASPKSIGQMHRAQLAKRLLDQTSLRISEVALTAGYGSVRRFNDELRSLFGRTPSQMRQSPRRASAQPSCGGISLQLPIREPFNADWVFGFLGRRALASLEVVEGHRYMRRVRDDHWITVSYRAAGLTLGVPDALIHETAGIVANTRRIFDLDADPKVIDERLAESGTLREWVADAAGIRVPGVWNGFEYAVRAILGQQVSVDRATALADELFRRFGSTPESLADADVAAIGMPGTRGEAVRSLARLMLTRGDELFFDADEARNLLLAIRGIGPWTAEYIAMRVMRDPDAFPDSDWVVKKMLKVSGAQVRRMAEAWRPWRAYAVMYLWYGASRVRADADLRTRAKTSAKTGSKTRVKRAVKSG